MLTRKVKLCGPNLQQTARIGRRIYLMLTKRMFICATYLDQSKIANSSDMKR